MLIIGLQLGQYNYTLSNEVGYNINSVNNRVEKEAHAHKSKNQEIVIDSLIKAKPACSQGANYWI